MVLLFIALALLVLWLIGLGVKAVAWLTWLVFAAGIVMLIVFFVNRTRGMRTGPV
ncbi:MAG TPA: hypothetical protein VGQ83_11820 [Polyangia bacterium]|jgi:hypothetical protein